MTGPRKVRADELRAAVCFVQLSEPLAEDFAQSSAGAAQNGLIVMFPGDRPEDTRARS